MNHISMFITENYDYWSIVELMPSVTLK